MAELRQSENIHRFASKLAKVAFWRWSFQEEKITHWSDEYEAINGFTDGVPSTYEEMLTPVHEDDRERVLQTYLQSDVGPSDYSVEFRIVDCDGNVRWLCEQAEVEYGPDGKALAHIGIIQDITHQHDISNETKRLNRILKGISEADRALMRADSEQELLDRICNIIVDMGGYSLAWIGYVQEGPEKIVKPVSWAGPSSDYLAEVKVEWGDTPLGQGPTGIALRTGVVSIVHDTRTDPKFEPWREQALQRGYLSTMAFPLYMDGLPFGVIAVYNKEANTINEEEIRLFSNFADNIVFGLQTLRNKERRDRAEAELRLAHDELEYRVVERTRELTDEIVERERVEKHLRQSQETLLETVEAISDGFVLFDSDERLVVSNEGYRSLYKDKRSAVVPGVSFEELTHLIADTNIFISEEETKENWIKTRLEDFRNPKGTTEHHLADGRWVLSTDRRTPSGGTVIIKTDITGNKVAEEELRIAKEKATVASRAKSDLMANMSHELRTPLNAIIGFSGSMKEEIFGPLGNEKYREYQDFIHHSGQHLLDLINDILDVSAFEAGALELHEDTADLADIVEASVNIIRPRAEKGLVTLNVSVDPSIPLIYVDSRRFKQVLLNLLSNAVKFTPEDGEVSLCAQWNEDGSLSLVVADTGVGMDEEEVTLALSSFGQVDSGLNRKHEGTGLGLPLAKGLIERHGGTLEIMSKKDQGTKATITLPKDRVVQSKPKN